ncbi:MAG TPA: hypothetical protein VMU45_09010 [Candidatus Eisenbacteria bacterium]|nr:hypothetical protein [Candidatus Eisenbacteria bacterium]
MKQLSWVIMALTLLCGTAPPAQAQVRSRDPLTDAEVDQMREAADYPNKRLELMVKFARERISMIELSRSDPPSADRPKQIHDYLEDFIALLDEIEDNIDMYESHNADMRKGLKLLIEANSEWQLKLRQLKEQSPPDELQQYSFVLSNAVDTVGDSAKNARETLEEQNKLAAQKKLVKDYSERKD